MSNAVLLIGVMALICIVFGAGMALLEDLHWEKIEQDYKVHKTRKMDRPGLIQVQRGKKRAG